eukprot:scaffold1221_cov207-Amphora_coffeaeformis.AAC.5
MARLRSVSADALGIGSTCECEENSVDALVPEFMPLEKDLDKPPSSYSPTNRSIPLTPGAKFANKSNYDAISMKIGAFDKKISLWYKKQRSPAPALPPTVRRDCPCHEGSFARGPRMFELCVKKHFYMPTMCHACTMDANYVV